MNEEPIYLNYGDAQIDLSAFLNAAANNMENYLSLLSWSSKRKDLFRKAYLDIMSKGITGASNSTGTWNIQFNGDPINLDSLSRKEREMYGEAAYYIQQLMSSIPTKLSLEEAENKKKSELPLFDNAYLTKLFNGYIGNQMYGGQDWDIETLWNKLDLANKDGIRGTKKRSEKLASMLEGYLGTLKEGEHNFEGSPFADLNDFKARVEKAISALRNENPDDDEEALNLIGLNINTYLRTGADDEMTLPDGTKMTRAEYIEARNKAQAELLAAKLKVEQLAAQQRAYNNTYFTSRLSAKLLGSNPQHLKLKYGDGLLSALNSYAEKGLENLSSDEKSDLHGAFRFLAKDNVNQETYNILKKIARYKGVSPGRFKQIKGVLGFVWDSAANLVVQLQNRALRDNSINLPRDILSGVLTLEELKLLKKDLAENRNVSEGFKTEDYLRMGAMAQDILGAVAAYIPGYGTAASAGLGLTSLGTNMAADIADESVSKLDVAKNAGINLGLGVIGLIPGLGTAGKASKWATNLAKWTPRILTLAAAGQVALSDDIQASLKKAGSGNWSNITNHDMKNIAYALSTVAGLSRGARGVVDNRKYRPAVTAGLKLLKQITTTSGKKVNVTDELVKQLNKIGKSKGNDAANKYLNEEILRNPRGTEKVNVEFKTGIRGKVTSPKVKSETVTVQEAVSPRLRAYLLALRRQNLYRKSGQGMYRFAPRFLPTSYDIYMGAANMNLPSWRLTDRMRDFMDPMRRVRVPAELTAQTQQTTLIPDYIVSRFTNPTRRAAREYRNSIDKAINPRGSSKPIKVNNVGTAEASINVNGENIKFTYAKDASGLYNLIIDRGGRTNTLKVNDDFDVKRLVAQTIELARKEGRVKARTNKTKNDLKMSELIKQVRQLKKVGFLQKGGHINADTIISEFLKKLK